MSIGRVDLYRRISENRTNSAVLIALFVMLLTVFGLAVGYAVGAPVLGAFGAMAIAALVAAVAYWSADGAILSMSGAKEVTKAENPYLLNTVEGLSLAAGLPTPKAYIINSAAPNAFATGRDPRHASIAVTRGLLENESADVRLQGLADLVELRGDGLRRLVECIDELVELHRLVAHEQDRSIRGSEQQTRGRLSIVRPRESHCGADQEKEWNTEPCIGSHEAFDACEIECFPAANGIHVSPEHGPSVSGMVLALGVTFQLRPVEVHLPQVAGAVALRLIIEMRGCGSAAFAAGAYGPGPDGLAELDDSDETVAAGAVPLFRPRVGTSAE